MMVQVFGLPQERIWVSVYEDDQEAFDLWEQKVHAHPVCPMAPAASVEVHACFLKSHSISNPSKAVAGKS